MRLWLLNGLTIAFLALCVGAGIVWHEVLWRAGWFQGPPKLAQGMPPQVGDYSPAWSGRLRQAFPVGTPEGRLVSQLQAQGFELDRMRRRAAYGWAVYPCVYTLTVAWRSDPEHRVRFVQGGLLNACTDPKKLLPQGPSRRPRGFAPDGVGRPLVQGVQSA